MYKLEYLPSARVDIVQTEVYLYKHSPSAADKFAESIEKLTDTLLKHPFLFPLYENNPYFRHMILPYKYRLFYLELS